MLQPCISTVQTAILYFYLKPRKLQSRPTNPQFPLEQRFLSQCTKYKLRRSKLPDPFLHRTRIRRPFRQILQGTTLKIPSSTRIPELVSAFPQSRSVNIPNRSVQIHAQSLQLSAPNFPLLQQPLLILILVRIHLAFGFAKRIVKRRRGRGMPLAPTRVDEEQGRLGRRGLRGGR